MTNQAHPLLHDIPIGIDATGLRHETDSMGGIDVPADRYWGAQTQRSLVHFSIGDDHMPKAVYHAYGYVKKAAALVNAAAGRLPRWKADAIVGMAALLGIGTVVMTLLGRCDDRVTTAITTTVVMVVAAMSPQDAWHQPLLRLVGTVVGIAVSVTCQWLASFLYYRLIGEQA
jgi:hypothetical protein